MRTYTITGGRRIRTWGGWYRHDVVKVDGQEIGRIGAAQEWAH